MKTWRQQAVLGSTIVKRQAEIILVIGADRWSRQEIVDKLRCGNLAAAKILSAAVATLNVRNARHMANTVTMDDLFAIKGVGITTMYVWMCVLAYIGRNPVRWLDSPEPRTLATLKKNALARQIEEVTK